MNNNIYDVMETRKRRLRMLKNIPIWFEPNFDKDGNFLGVSIMTDIKYSRYYKDYTDIPKECYVKTGKNDLEINGCIYKF